MRRGSIVRALLGAAILISILAGPAAAETPAAVAEAILDDGVYVAPGSDIDEAALAVAVATARRNGLEIVAIAPAEPLPNAEAFGLRVLQASGVAGLEAIVVFTEDGMHEVVLVDEYKDRILRSLEAARSAATPADAVAAVTVVVLAAPEPSVPAAIDTVSNWIFILVAVLGGAVIIDLLWRQRLRRKYQAKRDQANRVQSNA